MWDWVGLQPHEHVGLGLLPGPVQLGLGDAVLGRLPDHGQNGVQRLSSVSRPRAV